jgi:hypothetical protein
MGGEILEGDDSERHLVWLAGAAALGPLKARCYVLSVGRNDVEERVDEA